MAREPICNGIYQLGNKETISLPVAIPGLPDTITAAGHTLKKRPEFHVSLVCTGQIRTRHRLTDEHFTEEIVRAFCDYVERHSVVFVRFRDEFRFVELGEQKTVVVMVEVSNLEGFFDYMNEAYGLRMEYPQTHVTLYTLDGEPGIFLIDSGDIKERTRIIPNPELTFP